MRRPVITVVLFPCLCVRVTVGVRNSVARQPALFPVIAGNRNQYYTGSNIRVFTRMHRSISSTPFTVYSGSDPPAPFVLVLLPCRSGTLCSGSFHSIPSSLICCRGFKAIAISTLCCVPSPFSRSGRYGSLNPRPDVLFDSDRATGHLAFQPVRPRRGQPLYSYSDYCVL